MQEQARSGAFQAKPQRRGTFECVCLAQHSCIVSPHKTSTTSIRTGVGKLNASTPPPPPVRGDAFSSRTVAAAGAVLAAITGADSGGGDDRFTSHGSFASLKSAASGAASPSRKRGPRLRKRVVTTLQASSPQAARDEPASPPLVEEVDGPASEVSPIAATAGKEPWWGGVAVASGGEGGHDDDGGGGGFDPARGVLSGGPISGWEGGNEDAATALGAVQARQHALMHRQREDDIKRAMLAEFRADVVRGGGGGGAGSGAGRPQTATGVMGASGGEKASGGAPGFTSVALQCELMLARARVFAAAAASHNMVLLSAATASQQVSVCVCMQECIGRCLPAYTHALCIR